jgi:hypothetical protein
VFSRSGPRRRLACATAGSWPRSGSASATGRWRSSRPCRRAHSPADPSPGSRRETPTSRLFRRVSDEFVLKQVGGHKRCQRGGHRRRPAPTQHQSAIDLQVRVAYSRLHRELERQSGRREKCGPGIEWWRIPLHAITSCSSIRARIFSTELSADSLVLLSRTVRAAPSCEHSSTGTPFTLTLFRGRATLG